MLTVFPYVRAYPDAAYNGNKHLKDIVPVYMKPSVAKEYYQHYDTE